MEGSGKGRESRTLVIFTLKKRYQISEMCRYTLLCCVSCLTSVAVPPSDSDWRVIRAVAAGIPVSPVSSRKITAVVTTQTATMRFFAGEN
jgi:hypothetical protein